MFTPYILTRERVRNYYAERREHLYYEYEDYWACYHEDFTHLPGVLYREVPVSVLQGPIPWGWTARVCLRKRS